jgi:hypothetical protein
MDIANKIIESLTAWESATPRTKQARDGILGPSDIGFCRQKAVLMTTGLQPTDNPPKWSAAVGTAVHNYVENAIKTSHPDWLVGSIDHVEVTATLPSGVEIKGHPDIVIPKENAVIDIKTVDGLAYIRNQGASLQHKYQRHLYALGLVQAGVLSADKPVIVGNLYMDRSGKEPTPLLLAEEMDPMLTGEIDLWVEDVIYAVKNKEDANRDVAAPVCERICEFYTVCRGSLPDSESDMIEDTELINAVDAYVRGREMEKEGASLKKEAQVLLAGVSGSTGTHQVRWTEVQPTVVESFQKNGYMRMDVRTLRGR